ncbi:hypothetical protein FZZ93_07430 [Halomonas eurihalina]|uniref:Glycosyl transferase family 51 domain-containing protein n=1 Tax=Halomonas eurihalina TaxID=42566 RepID=A0A5D9D9G6_HALER|nr:biosynthetic peptidoglycan transglycosylase [Halomonas eurihalina]MDR5860705.1 transglycosylase domain-containing protein [Halomonas eurihalina]TZG40073.1 hypothetical protein FZZ93_07430 [Halomonas eurihalina]
MYGFGRNKPTSIFDLKGWLVFFNIELDGVLKFSYSQNFSTSLALSENASLIESAVLALEDRYFFTHKGIDFRCFFRIASQFFRRKRLGGVSTIEQQLVRTVLNRKERRLGRKFNEMVVARLLWYHMNKREVLGAYVSCAYYGYKLNGCDAASNFLFGVKSRELNVAQAVFIASLLVYPLPKAVRNSLPKQAEVDQILRHARSIDLLWANKMERRFRYGLELMSNVD